MLVRDLMPSSLRMDDLHQQLRCGAMFHVETRVQRTLLRESCCVVNYSSMESRSASAVVNMLQKPPLLLS